MRRTVFAAVVAAVLLVPLRSSAQPDTSDTRLLQMPAVSRDHIAFVYAEDLWIGDRDGRNVRRLTSAPGLESHPVFRRTGGRSPSAHRTMRPAWAARPARTSTPSRSRAASPPG